MSDEKKKMSDTADQEQKELDFEELDEVHGGSLRNVTITQTRDISDDTKGKL
jgi:hypothetical protein